MIVYKFGWKKCWISDKFGWKKTLKNELEDDHNFLKTVFSSPYQDLLMLEDKFCKIPAILQFWLEEDF